MDLVGNNRYVHLEFTGATVFEDVGRDFGGCDPDFQANTRRHLVMVRPEGIQSGLNITEGSRAGGDVQFHLSTPLGTSEWQDSPLAVGMILRRKSPNVQRIVELRGAVLYAVL